MAKCISLYSFYSYIFLYLSDRIFKIMGDTPMKNVKQMRRVVKEQTSLIGLNLIVKARLVKGNYYKRNTTNPISLSVIWILRL